MYFNIAHMDLIESEFKQPRPQSNFETIVLA